MTEIITGSLWQCGLAELPSEVENVKPDIILNLTEGEDTPYPASLFMHWPIEDGPLPDMLYAKRIASFLTYMIRQKQKVIVHCAAGMNRASLVDCLILLNIRNISGTKAIEYLETLRPGVLTNLEFRTYLENQ